MACSAPPAGLMRCIVVELTTGALGCKEFTPSRASSCVGPEQGISVRGCKNILQTAAGEQRHKQVSNLTIGAQSLGLTEAFQLLLLLIPVIW